MFCCNGRKKVPVTEAVAGDLGCSTAVVCIDAGSDCKRKLDVVAGCVWAMMSSCGSKSDPAGSSCRWCMSLNTVEN